MIVVDCPWCDGPAQVLEASVDCPACGVSVELEPEVPALEVAA